MIRILLVDDHAVVREGYRRLLERRTDLTVAGEAASGAEGYRMFHELSPDLAIVDLALPDMGGIELISRILRREPAARLLAFSMHRDPLFATHALRAGALGYVTKSCPPEFLVQAVYKVAKRERVVSPDIAPELALALVDPPDDPARLLSPREFEVLRLLLEGRSTEEIGGALSLSPKTVQNCHYQIKAKLGVRSDLELARLALRHKLL
jgi:two-component system, NarL family, invasion response regulator UvrY